ncbi:MAG: hypothetical protein LBT98_01300 [Puniceicoccales bacterium]|jgi:hypothetical protein|nr:hypothetical protein [Puniceicoccales bacterium]
MGIFFAFLLENFPFDGLVFDRAWPVVTVAGLCRRAESYILGGHSSVKFLLLVFTVLTVPIVHVGCLLLLLPALIVCPIIGNYSMLRTIGALLTLAHVRVIFADPDGGGRGVDWLARFPATDQEEELIKRQVFQEEEGQNWIGPIDANTLASAYAAPPLDGMGFGGHKDFVPILAMLKEQIDAFLKKQDNPPEYRRIFFQISLGLWEMARDLVRAYAKNPGMFQVNALSLIPEPVESVAVEKNIKKIVEPHTKTPAVILEKFKDLCRELGSFLDACIDAMQIGIAKIRTRLKIEQLEKNASAEERFNALCPILCDRILERFIGEISAGKGWYQNNVDTVEVGTLLNNLLAYLGVHGFSHRPLHFHKIAWDHLVIFYDYSGIGDPNSIPPPKMLAVWREEAKLLATSNGAMTALYQRASWALIQKFLPYVSGDKIYEEILNCGDAIFSNCLLGGFHIYDEFLTDDLWEYLSPMLLSGKDSDYVARVNDAQKVLSGTKIEDISGIAAAYVDKTAAKAEKAKDGKMNEDPSNDADAEEEETAKEGKAAIFLDEAMLHDGMRNVVVYKTLKLWREILAPIVARSLEWNNRECAVRQEKE